MFISTLREIEIQKVILLQSATFSAQDMHILKSHVSPNMVHLSFSPHALNWEKYRMKKHGPLLHSCAS